MILRPALTPLLLILLSFVSGEGAFAAKRTSFPPSNAVVAAPVCEKKLLPQSSVVVVKSDSSIPELALLDPQALSFVQSRGTFDQPMAAQVVDGKPVVFGTAAAIGKAKPDLAKHMSILAEVGGMAAHYDIDGAPVDIRTAPLLSGSTAVTDEYGDVDIETVVALIHPGFTEKELHRADSVSAKALARYLQDWIQHVQGLGRYALTDFKAGEYDYVPNTEAAQKTRSTAIKWTLPEILAGQKTIMTRSGEPRTLTLEEAVTSETRVKVDFVFEGDALPSVRKATGLTRRKIETSVLLHIGGKRPNGHAVLRVADKDHIPEPGATGGHMRPKGSGGYVPLRMTTYARDAAEAELAREVSVVTPSMPIEWTNAHILEVCRTYMARHDYYKVIKRLAGRINYWNDVSVYNRAFGADFTAAEMMNRLNGILAAEPIATLYHLKVMAEPIDLLRKSGHPDEAAEKEFIAAANAYAAQVDPFWEKRADIQSLQDAIGRRVEKLVDQKLRQAPELMNYVSFVLRIDNRFELQRGAKDPIFIAYRPDPQFVAAYAQALPALRAQYPKLDFLHPDDLHMTLTFLGTPTPEVRERVEQVLTSFQAELASQPFDLDQGGIRVMGKNRWVSIVWSESSLPPAVAQMIQHLKDDLAKAGVRPDDYISQFLPHISFLKTEGALRGEMQEQLHSFLGESPLPAEMMRLHVDGRISIMHSLGVTGPTGGPRYSDTDISIEDLDRD